MFISISLKYNLFKNVLIMHITPKGLKTLTNNSYINSPGEVDGTPSPLTKSIRNSEDDKQIYIEMNKYYLSTIPILVSIEFRSRQGV